MKLYTRDYTQLTAEEEAEWLAIQAQEIVSQSGQFVIKQSLFHKYPKAARHFKHLFPNNYLDVMELQNRERLQQAVRDFECLLDSTDVNERAVLKFYQLQGRLFHRRFPFEDILPFWSSRGVFVPRVPTREFVSG